MIGANLRHGEGNLSSKVLKQFSEKLKLIHLLNHTFFLSRKTKTHDRGHRGKLHFTCITESRMASVKVYEFTSEVWRGTGCSLRKANNPFTEEGEGSALKCSCKTLQLTPWPTAPRLLNTQRGVSVQEKTETCPARCTHACWKQTVDEHREKRLSQMNCTYRKSCLIKFGFVFCSSLKMALALESEMNTWYVM